MSWCIFLKLIRLSRRMCTKVLFKIKCSVSNISIRVVYVVSIAPIYAIHSVLLSANVRSSERVREDSEPQVGLKTASRSPCSTLVGLGKLLLHGQVKKNFPKRPEFCVHTDKLCSTFHMGYVTCHLKCDLMFLNTILIVLKQVWTYFLLYWPHKYFISKLKFVLSSFSNMPELPKTPQIY